MENITDSINVIILVKTIEELEKKFNDLNDLHEILTEQYHQTVKDNNARFMQLEQQIKIMQESLIAIAFTNKEN